MIIKTESDYRRAIWKHRLEHENLTDDEANVLKVCCWDLTAAIAKHWDEDDEQ